MSDHLREWLEGLGLGKHADALIKNEIDFDVLPDLTEADLANLGLPIPILSSWLCVARASIR